MTESNEFNDFMKATPEYAELMSILESTKKEISKLQVNVQASVDLKNLPEKELTKKVDWMINNNQKEETRDEYLCCLLSDMTEKSELNRTLFWKTKKWEDFLTKDEESLLSGIDVWRTQYLNEHISEPDTKNKLKSLLKKLVTAYKEEKKNDGKE